MMTEIAFSHTDYRRVVDDLDAILDFVRKNFGKTEHESREWLKNFITIHYLPVWREMNYDH